VRRLLETLLLVTALSATWAVPAIAGEVVEGDGYEVRLPAGFQEALSIENSGGLRIKSRFGNLPVEGMPEIKAFIAGSSAAPSGMIMLARVNLSRAITTAEELGLDRVDELKEQLPEGADIRATSVAGHSAIELIIHQDGYEGARTARVASIAAGKYVVVVMLETSDEAHGDTTAIWSTMLASMKVEPGMNKLLLFGIVGVVGLAGLWFLGRIRSRPAHEVPTYTGRFKREDSVDTGVAFTPRATIETGVRPKVLTNRPAAEMAAMGATRAGLGVARPAGGPAGGMAPIRIPTSPAVTRPAPSAPAPRTGLRRTRPDTGRWGD